ncbi:MAG: thiamine pyrophosphate-dependent enzyme, partial [Spirochaetota bacterium]
GPVVIDVPKDVLLQQCELSSGHAPAQKEPPQPRQRDIEAAAYMIAASQRPVIYAGGGIILGDACRELADLSAKNSIPVALTLMGLGSFPRSEALSLGMIGMHGDPAANTLFDEADLLIALGVRFDDRAVGIISEFCPKAAVLHIDIDGAELGKLRSGALCIRSDLKKALIPLTEVLPENPRSSWRERVFALKSQPRAYTGEQSPMHPAHVIQRISALAPGDIIVTTDVGQHQMWTAQNFEFNEARSFLTSGGLGTMGFGLPAAIGASLAIPGKKVICITGDGSIQMNIQELATLSELGLSVSIFLLNNGHLGLVRQQQELFYEKNYFASAFERGTDFTAVARGYGIEAMRVSSQDELEKCIRKAFSLTAPFLAEIMTEKEANVLPMVPPGAANRNMIGGYYE